MLAHLLESGGRATSVQTCAALDIKNRETLAAHARRLARAKLVRVKQTGRGRCRSALLMITEKGRVAVAGDRNLLAPQMPP